MISRSLPVADNWIDEDGEEPTIWKRMERGAQVGGNGVILLKNAG